MIIALMGFQHGGEPRGCSCDSSPPKPVTPALPREVSVCLKQKMLNRPQS